MKKFYLCKLCLIVLGASLVLLTHRQSLAESPKYPQAFECEGQSSNISWYKDEKIKVFIEADAIKVNHFSKAKPYVYEYDLHSFEVDGFDFLVGKRVDVLGQIGLSGSTLSIENGTVFIDLKAQTMIEDNYNFMPQDGPSSLEERGAFWVEYQCKEN